MTHQQNGPWRRFERLSYLRDYEVERHQVDPRGWNIRGRDGRTIGEVKDLVVDTESMRARYLDVELDAKLFDLRDDPRVLVPVERAHRDGDHRRLTVDGLTTERVPQLCAARAQHYAEFWDKWWGVSDSTAGEQTWVTRVAPRTSTDALHRAIDDVRPGEQVRIPVVKEEVIIERRPVHPDELVTAKERDALDRHTPRE
jgi:hypothetical protein